jgi:hypothetical protein
MIKIGFHTQAGYRHALDWLGDYWTGESLSDPAHIVSFYEHHAVVFVPDSELENLLDSYLPTKPILK